MRPKIYYFLKKFLNLAKLYLKRKIRIDDLTEWILSRKIYYTVLQGLIVTLIEEKNLADW